MGQWRLGLRLALALVWVTQPGDGLSTPRHVPFRSRAAAARTCAPADSPKGLHVRSGGGSVRSRCLQLDGRNRSAMGCDDGRRRPPSSMALQDMTVRPPPPDSRTHFYLGTHNLSADAQSNPLCAFAGPHRVPLARDDDA